MSKKKNKRYVLLTDFTIKAGTVFDLGPRKTEYVSDHYMHTIGFGNDFVLDMIADEELFENNKGRPGTLKTIAGSCRTPHQPQPPS